MPAQEPAACHCHSDTCVSCVLRSNVHILCLPHSLQEGSTVNCRGGESGSAVGLPAFCRSSPDTSYGLGLQSHNERGPRTWLYYTHFQPSQPAATEPFLPKLIFHLNKSRHTDGWPISMEVGTQHIEGSLDHTD
jgi:hypothetical protein